MTTQRSGPLSDVERKNAIAEIEALGFSAYESNKVGTDGKAVYVSAEDGVAEYAYWVNPKLDELALRLGMYWEWYDAGSIFLNW